MTAKNNVTVYKCDFCKKKLFMKHAMVRHEKYCESNPENSKACVMCKHLEETTIEVESGYLNEWGESQTRNVKAFKCTKLDKMVYPTKVERLGLIEKYPETFEDQIPMPKECKHFIGEWEFGSTSF